MMKKTKQFFLATVAAACGLAASAVQAQNANHTPGDLVLFFQNPGGTVGADQQVYVSLGNTATVFRNAYENGINLYNVINIGDLLSSTFGANWASETTLYGGLGGVWGTAALGNQLQNGDPNRTVYTSQARNSLGTVGAQNSIGYSIAGNTAMTSISNSINGQNLLFETQGTLQANAIEITLAQGTSNVPGQNPVGGSSWNNNIPNPGVQQGGASGNFGTFDTISDAEFLWDIYRIQARDNIAGQWGQGDGVRQGLFLGTVVLDSTGNVSFVTTAVPEPSTAMLTLIGLAVAAFKTRRRRA